MEPNMHADDVYESSYDDISVHELMLKDEPRTLAYKHFIENNPHLFRRKVIMDVGAGTGILSLFAANVGAKKVYAIEVSGISRLCKKIVEKNKMGAIIQVIKGRVEDVDVPEKVDVIISEWMGFYLLHESMLQSLIVARDKFLKCDGVIFPSVANLYACPTSIKSRHSEIKKFWENVYGFNFSPVADEILNPSITTNDTTSRGTKDVSHIPMDSGDHAETNPLIGDGQPINAPKKEPNLLALRPNDLLSDPHLVTAIDLMYADANDFEKISTSLSFTFSKHDIIRGIALWFDVIFGNQDDDNDDEPNVEKMDPVSPKLDTANDDSKQFHPSKNAKNSIKKVPTASATPITKPTTFSTSPRHPPTHWKQTVIPFTQSYFVDPGSQFKCDLTLTRDEVNRRRYNITVEVEEEEDGDDEDDDDIKNVDNDVRAEYEELIRNKMTDEC